MTYVLLIVVAIIWGYIFYKFFSDVKSNNDTIYYRNEPMLMPLVEDSIDTKFTLKANYRDPFLGNFLKLNPSYKGNKARKAKITPNVTIPLPAITFLGLITNNQEKRKIGMLQINGVNHMVKQNDKIDDLTVKLITKDSVIIIFHKINKAYKKAKL